MKSSNEKQSILRESLPLKFFNQSIANMNSRDVFKVCSFVATNKDRIYDEHENKNHMIKSLTQNEPLKLKAFLNKFN